MANWRAVLPIAEAFVAASVAPAIVFAIWAMSARVLLPAFVVALAHAVLLGVPLFALLRWRNWVNPITTILGAFIVGCIPMAVWSWPLLDPELKATASDSTWGQTMIDGVPTAAGWLSYASGVLMSGAFGIVAGVAFGSTFRYVRKRTPTNSCWVSPGRAAERKGRAQG